MKKLLLIAVLGSMAGATVPAMAQPGWGWGWGGGSHHASTLEEGAARGTADVIRSAGMANLLNSKAAINYEQARSALMDNRLKWTKTYFEMRRYNKEYRAAAQRPRPTSEQLFRLAKQATPKAMATTELDPVTGAVAWPMVLKQDAYAKYRQELDELFRARAEASGQMTMDQFKAITKNLADMKIVLKRQVSEIPPQVFTSTNSFLRRLEHAVNTSI